MKDPLLILALSFGMGHLTAAEGVAEAWEARVGEKPKVWDAIAYLPLWFRAIYVAPFWAMVRYTPFLWRILFERRLAKDHRHTIPVWLLRCGARNLLARILDVRPRIILACEVGACEIASLYKMEINSCVRIAALLTDFQAEPAWVQPGIDLYLAPSQEIASQLRQWSKVSLSIEVVGLPVRSGFTRTRSKSEARVEHGLRDRPTILLMSGGMGPCRLESVLEELLNASSGILQIIALAGKDDSLRERLSALRTSGAHLIVLGWTDNVNEYMEMADVLITKPGALTLSEAFAMGLPTVVFDPLHMHEERNADEAVRRGFAVQARNSVDAARIALQIVKGEVEVNFRSTDPVGEPAADRIAMCLDRLARKVEIRSV